MASRSAQTAKNMSTFLLAAVFLLANGLFSSFTPQAHATTPQEGICTLAVAFDTDLADENSDEYDFFFDLFAEEGVGVVEGRDTLLVIAVLLFNQDNDRYTESDCDAGRDSLTQQLAPLGVTPSVTFLAHTLTGAADKIAARAELTLEKDGVPLDWSVLGGLTRMTSQPIPLQNGGATALVDLAASGSDANAVTAQLVLALPENTAGAYRIDVDVVVWDEGKNPDVDDPSLAVAQHLDMVVGPPLGACLTTLMFDVDLIDAALQNLNDLQQALEAEEDALNDEKALLVAPDPRISEIDQRLAEINVELDGFEALYTQAILDGVVTELQPSMRIELNTSAIAPIFGSECALRGGPNTVFLPAHGPNQPLAGVTDMAVDITLARDGGPARWDDLGAGFTFTETTELFADDANMTIPFAIDDTRLLSGLVPAPFDPLSQQFLMGMEFVSLATLTPGTYTLTTAFLDSDDPDAPEIVGTTNVNFTVAGTQNVQGLVPVNPELETDEEQDDVSEEPDEVEGSFTCSAPVVGVGGSCEVRSAPGQTFRWEASTNPVFASGEVTTDPLGVGTFAFDVPASLAGRQIVVRIIGLAGPATPIGVASVAVPTGVPAGEGPPLAPFFVWLLIGAGFLAAMRFVRRSRTTRPV